MTIAVFTGGEGGAYSAASEYLATFSSLGTTPIIQNSGARSGNHCFRAAPNAQSQMRINAGRTDGLGLWVGAGFKMSTSFPSVNQRIHSVGGGGLLDVFLTTAGDIIVQFSGVTQATVAVSLGTYFYVEMFSMISVAGNDTWEVWLDDTQIYARSGNNDTATLFTNNDFGPHAAYGTSRTLDWDDVYILDTNGSAPVNERLGMPKIVSSFPVGDISRTDWTDYDNSTSNLYQSLDNRPPNPVGPTSGVQTADIGIKDPVSSTTANYVCEVSSANEVGIDADDTIIATQLVLTHGLDSATSTTVTSQQILANNGHPGTSETNNDANAASSTWPTNWVVGKTLTESPSITDRSVRPQVEIGKRTATTRIPAVGQARIDWLYKPVTGGVSRVYKRDPLRGLRAR